MNPCQGGDPDALHRPKHPAGRHGTIRHRCGLPPGRLCKAGKRHRVVQSRPTGPQISEPALRLSPDLLRKQHRGVGPCGLPPHCGAVHPQLSGRALFRDPQPPCIERRPAAKGAAGLFYGGILSAQTGAAAASGLSPSLQGAASGGLCPALHRCMEQRPLRPAQGTGRPGDRRLRWRPPGGAGGLLGRLRLHVADRDRRTARIPPSGHRLRPDQPAGAGHPGAGQSPLLLRRLVQHQIGAQRHTQRLPPRMGGTDRQKRLLCG